jgi:hypothetical protein
MQDAVELHRPLLAGGDVHEEHDGLTLLHAAIDVEMDGHWLACALFERWSPPRGE